MPSLFSSLPFREAIDALYDRLALRKPEFLELDRRARSRAFTMAWVEDQRVLEDVHDALGQAISEGETFAQFERRLFGKRTEGAEPGSAGERLGFPGTAAWHHRLVYETNLGMAYSAGRVQQGAESGLKVWRYLPSISEQPRPDHEQYYGSLFRWEAGSVMPPWDFNCACGWEWVFPEELEAMGVNPADLPVFDPPPPASGFAWSPSDYVLGRL